MHSWFNKSLFFAIFYFKNFAHFQKIFLQKIASLLLKLKGRALVKNIGLKNARQFTRRVFLKLNFFIQVSPLNSR